MKNERRQGDDGEPNARVSPPRDTPGKASNNNAATPGFLFHFRSVSALVPTLARADGPTCQGPTPKDGSMRTCKDRREHAHLGTFHIYCT